MNDEFKTDVSVIIPVFNQEKKIVECMDSIINQTGINYEIICIDDGSTDSSYKILKKYESLNPEKIKVIHTENNGVWVAREIGLENAKGKYILFCDSDDYVEKSMLQVMYERIVSTNADICVCAFDRKKKDKVISVEMKNFGNTTIDIEKNIDLLPLINTSLWNKMIRKNIAEKHVFLSNPPRIAEDMMFLLSIYPFCNKITFCSKVLYHYCIFSTSLMSSVSSFEIPNLIKTIFKTRNYVLSKKNYNWNDIITIFIFIHFKISILLRIDKKSEANIIVNKLLDEYIPKWYNNKYLSLKYVFFHNKKYFKIFIIFLFDRTKFLIPFIKIYNFISKYIIFIGW